MANRHVKTSAEEIWESWEWLFREKLESLDSMARQMFQELVFCRLSNDQARKFMSERFSQLWRQVADEQEEIHGKFRRKGA